ncbi:MAG: L,D-transpeptidase [Bifidobacteriaceae bacterium]|jgi:lipoprotein-anchoring transpeptidase ErfK/SrfK|nr:L,D-transpeptidase [Bifidobacteriaceae bacterium]
MTVVIPENGKDKRRLVLAGLLGAIGLALLAILAWLALFWALLVHPAQAAPPVPVEVIVTLPPPVEAKQAPPAAQAEGPFRIAHLTGDVTAYSEPGGTASGLVEGSWWTYPSALPVIDERDGYLLVRLQQRPNQSTAWIAAEGIEITETPYRIVVDLRTHRLRLLNRGEEEMNVPAIIGRPATPTPAGHYFVTMFHPGASPGYGKWVVYLSAHSETIDNWMGTGDAITAIHGPLGDEASVEAAGAISNGCIRIHLTDLDQLVATVPPGTPVDIENG